MKRSLIILSVFLFLLFPLAARGKEGQTLRTVSCFAGSDSAAEAYVNLLRDFETATGNTILDDSGTSNEAWKTSVLKRFAAGDEPDVLFYFAAGADSALLLNRLVPLQEIRQAYPDLNLPEETALTEADGQVYAIPVYSFWEGLFVNRRLFDQYGLDLPTDWEKLTRAIAVFHENGIVPIAVSLSDIPHYLAEFAMLACVDPGELALRPDTFSEVPASWLEGMRLIRNLAEAHTFPENAAFTEERVTTDLFLTGRAAMQFDGSWQVASIPADIAEDMVVLPMPRVQGGQAEVYPGGVSMGFFLTRRAWDSPRRDAAVSLLTWLTSEESLKKLYNRNLSDSLQASWEAMVQGRRMIRPLQDAMNQQARETWLLECIPAVAEGSMTAEECWQRVMELNPFGE